VGAGGACGSQRGIKGVSPGRGDPMKRLEKREFEEHCYLGLKQRSEKKGSNNRVEFLTVGCSGKSQIDLLKKFDSFTVELSDKKPIQWIAVLIKESVDNLLTDRKDVKFHLHALWAKPFVPMNKLRELWWYHANVHGSITNRTVKGSKSSRSEMSRLVNYLVNQEEKHNQFANVEGEVKYFESENWLAKDRNNCGQRQMETTL
jgi:hypothetical protein